MIASGQKLPPQRPLNEVLGAAGGGFAGPVLVPQGALDPLTGAERAQTRAAQLGALRDGVTVELLDAGHCPQDEAPERVADAIARWWPRVLEYHEQCEAALAAKAAPATAEPALAGS